jgi:hypothetical protein
VAEIQNECASVLARSQNTAVIALSGEDPACGPVLVDSVCGASLVVGHLDALVIRARNDATVEGVQEQRTDKTLMLDAAVDEVAGVGVELVDDVIVASSKNVLGIVGELDSCKAPVLRWEVLDGSAGLEVPKLGHTISAGGDKEVATELDSIDRTSVSLKRTDAGTSLAVPDLDHSILAARDNVLVVETNVQNTGLMTAESVHGDVLFAGDVPDDAGVVGRASNHDLVIVLQAKDRCIVVVGRDVVDLVAGLG